MGVSTIEFAVQHAPRWGLAPSGGIEPLRLLGRPTRPGLSLFIPLAGLSAAGQRGIRPHHRLLQTLQGQVFLPAVIKHRLQIPGEILKLAAHSDPQRPGFIIQNPIIKPAV